MLTKILQRVTAFLLCALVVIYIVIQISTALSTEIITELAGQNTIEEKVEVTGYVQRDETLLTAGASGVIHRSVEDGEKVANKQIVATVFASDTAVQVQTEISEINRALSVLEASVVDTNYATSDVTKQDNAIYSLLHDTRANTAKGKYNLSVQNHADLLIALNKRQLIVGDATDFSDKIDALQARKDALTASLVDALESIGSPQSGFYSSQVDGYENIFTDDALQSLTVDSFYALLARTPDAISPLTIGKIVGDFTWHLLCPIDRSHAASFTEGRLYSLAFPYSSDLRMSAALEKKVMQTDSDTVVLVFSCNEIPNGFNFTRSQTVQIILKSYTGLQIVKNALRRIGDSEGVYVLNGGTVFYKKVTRIYESEGYYLVAIRDAGDPEAAAYLELYDAVIVRGKDLYSGKVVA